MAGPVPNDARRVKQRIGLREQVLAASRIESARRFSLGSPHARLGCPRSHLDEDRCVLDRLHRPHRLTSEAHAANRNTFHWIEQGAISENVPLGF
jgi:hypothetical protein